MLLRKVYEREHLGCVTTHSHTQRFAGVCVDVEFVRPLPGIVDIARAHFAPGEICRLAALGPEQRLAEFYCCWTRKEALLKATGAGIAAGLASIEVSTLPQDSNWIVAGESIRACDWSTCAFGPRCGYVAAVAARCAPVQWALLS